MVAVVILAMVVFGIFLAFSTGFQGMADARDRTEAVNYIQKTLEEYKNSPFNKIIDKPMRQIVGTKFSNGSIVINMSVLGEETRLKKIITQVRWADRNGDIKIEEASTLIYNVEKTGELLSASEIVLYASPYFRILPNTSTDLFAEIRDANGNLITDESYTINFVILSGGTLGYLDPASENTTNGVATVKFYSNPDADGSVSIQASADLDDNVGDDVFDTITITISIGAEGIILEHASEFYPVEDPVEIDLYIVDASFNFESGIFGGYTDPIILNATGPATLSVNSITAPDGTASFTLYSNGTPGTVEIIASAPDLDLGYTEVTFTGGAEFIQLTPKDASIYEGGSIEITITILDENLNQTPFTGSISITSDSEGSFDPESPIGFVNQSFRTVDFSSSNVGTVIITASGTDFENDVSINLEVLESLNPSYIELSAIPSSVKAGGTKDDYSKITATVYDAENNIVTNYSGTITFDTSLTESYLDDDNLDLFDDLFDDSITLTPNDEGSCFLYLYSTSAGNTTITAEPSFYPYYLDPEGGVSVEFYSEASGLRISVSKGTVVANGVDFTEITVEIIDDSVPVPFVVSDYSGYISLTTDKGYFEGETGPGTITLTFDIEGSISINLYSDGIFGNATITAEGDVDSDGSLEPSESAYTTVTFTQPAAKNIILTADPIERYGAGHGNDEYVKFYIEVIGSNISLNSMKISWDDSSSRNLIEIAIKSPDTVTNYTPVISTDNASSPYTTNVNTPLYMGKSAVRLKFSKSIAGKTIEVIFYDNEEPSNSYPLEPPMIIDVPN